MAADISNRELYEGLIKAQKEIALTTTELIVKAIGSVAGFQFRMTQQLNSINSHIGYIYSLQFASIPMMIIGIVGNQIAALIAGLVLGALAFAGALMLHSKVNELDETISAWKAGIEEKPKETLVDS